jgi:hypothetical protein
MARSCEDSAGVSSAASDGDFLFLVAGSVGQSRFKATMVASRLLGEFLLSVWM